MDERVEFEECPRIGYTHFDNPFLPPPARPLSRFDSILLYQFYFVVVSANDLDLASTFSSIFTFFPSIQQRIVAFSVRALQRNDPSTLRRPICQLRSSKLGQLSSFCCCYYCRIQNGMKRIAGCYCRNARRNQIERDRDSFGRSRNGTGTGKVC